jgi:hypothetical protein
MPPNDCRAALARRTNGCAICPPEALRAAKRTTGINIPLTPKIKTNPPGSSQCPSAESVRLPFSTPQPTSPRHPLRCSFRLIPELENTLLNGDTMSVPRWARVIRTMGAGDENWTCGVALSPGRAGPVASFCLCQLWWPRPGARSGDLAGGGGDDGPTGPELAGRRWQRTTGLSAWASGSADVHGLHCAGRTTAAHRTGAGHGAFRTYQPGKSDKESVLRLLGPPVPQWTNYFKARDELVWEWQFCDSWNQLARFDVLFDATSGIVRTSLSAAALMGFDGVAPFCGALALTAAARPPWRAWAGSQNVTRRTLAEAQALAENGEERLVEVHSAGCEDSARCCRGNLDQLGFGRGDDVGAAPGCRLADHRHLAETLAGRQQVRMHAVLEDLEFPFGEEIEAIARIAVAQ